MSSRLHSLIKYTTLSKNIKIKIAFKRSIIALNVLQYLLKLMPNYVYE